MSNDSCRALEMAALLRAQAEHLRQLAAIDSGDPVYVTAAEQVAAIAAALESYAAPTTASRAVPPEDRSGIPNPRDPK